MMQQNNRSPSSLLAASEPLAEFGEAVLEGFGGSGGEQPFDRLGESGTSDDLAEFWARQIRASKPSSEVADEGLERWD